MNLDPKPLFKRVCNVIVGKDLSNSLASGIKLEGFRIVFTVDQSLRGSPNTASILIYNLHPTDEAAIKKEFNHVILEAGYEGLSRIIFRGNIKYPAHYREGNDWITEIQAADGDRAYTQDHIGITLSKGRTPEDAVNEILRISKDIKKGHIELPAISYTRGKVLSGPIPKILEQISRDAGANWSIQNGVLNIVRADSVISGIAIKLDSTSGLLSAPEVTEKGVKIKSLMNPQIEPNKVVQIDNNNVKIQVHQKIASGPKTKVKRPARLDPDGRYKVYKLRHQGDTRGSDWYTETEAIANRTQAS